MLFVNKSDKDLGFFKESDLILIRSPIQDTALKLYNALVMPLIDYCDVTYSTCYAKSAKKVDKLMMKGGRIVLRVPYDTPSVTVLNRLKWLTFAERTQYHKSIQMYKCLNAMSPDYLSCVFERVGLGYGARQSNSLKVIRCSTNMGQHLFVHSGANLWNTLPNSVKSSSSLHVFKSNMLKYLLSMHL